MDSVIIIQNLREKISIKQKLDYLREISTQAQDSNNDLKTIQSIFLNTSNTLNIAEQKELISYMTENDRNLLLKSPAARLLCRHDNKGTRSRQ